MVIKQQQRRWTVKAMNDEHEYMRDYTQSFETILLRAQQQTVHELAGQNEAMLKHIDDLESALGTLIKLWFGGVGYAEFYRAIADCSHKFAYLETDEEE